MDTRDLMLKGSIASSFKSFITTHFPGSRRHVLRNDDSLLASGIIDSLGVLDLVSFIESEFNVGVDDEDLTPENFQSIDRMTAFVERKRRTGA
jgi:acyl carrier protein